MAPALLSSGATAATIVSVTVGKSRTPTANFIYWGPTSDTCFSHWTVQRANDSSGPWASIWTSTDQGLHFADSALPPGGTTWYRVLDTDCQSAVAASSPVSITRPAAASLQALRISPGTVSLTWTNSGVYFAGENPPGFGFNFYSYDVYEDNILLGSITSVGTKSYVTDITNESHIFKVVTNDQWRYTNPVVSVSNVATVAALLPLAADFTYAHSGLAVSLTASASGGMGPYSYTWAFGDGKQETVSYDTIEHTYSASGNFTVTLGVSDSFGAQASTVRTVSVVSPPEQTPGNGPGNGGVLTSQSGIILLGVVVVAVAVGAVVVAMLLRRKKAKPPVPPPPPPE